MKKIAPTLASLVLAAGVAVTVLPAAPAAASVAQGRFCEPVGSFGRYHARYFYDGERVGEGPRRTFRSTAWRDCSRFVD